MDINTLHDAGQHGFDRGDGTQKSKSTQKHEKHVQTIETGRENLHDVIQPHESYEGWYRCDPSASWTHEEESAVVRKTDLRVLSFACLMFFSLQLDRGNGSNALASTLLQDLHINSNVTNNGATIQVLAFLIAEIPVQLLTKRYGFKRVLPTLMVAWGIVSWAQAFMTTKTGFYVTRAALGVTEGGFIPGLILFMTYFYTSRELTMRLTWLWATFNLTRVISAFMAAGILKMEGVQGRPGWFWLFVIEGVFTTLLGILAYLYLPNSPVQTTSILWRKPWYTEREEIIMVNRLLRDDPAKGLTDLKQPATWADIKGAWTDKSMWGLYLIGLVAYIPAQPVQGYLPLNLRRLGFSTINSNLLSAPAAGLQIILMLILGKSSQYFDERGFHCLFGEIWMMPFLAGLLGLPSHGHAWDRFALSTVLCGYPYFHPIATSWVSENSFDVRKRSITTATYNMLAQTGSIVASQIYRADDAPYFYRGNAILISISVLAMGVITGQKYYLKMLNRRKAALWNTMTLEEQVEYQEDQVAREKDGNKRLDLMFKN